MASKYLYNVNDENFVLLRLENYTFRGVVTIEDISGSDGVQTTSFLGTPVNVSERGYRRPYNFTISLILVNNNLLTVDEQITSILELRQLNKPLDFYFEKFVKYGIRKVNIIDYTASEYKNYAEVSLTCDEVIEYDVTILNLTDTSDYYYNGTTVIQDLSEFTTLVGVIGS